MGLHLLDGFGIGLNHHELSLRIPRTGTKLKITTIKRPTETVHLAPLSGHRKSDGADADKWISTNDPGKPWSVFRTVFNRTQNNEAYDSLPSRIINRLSGRASMLFIDGHAQARRASEAGFQRPRGHTLARWYRERPQTSSRR